jgi:flagellar hook protein FlgE
MSILASFNIGVTGLKAHGGSMSVIGDNIANAGTFGFKSSRAEFQDLMSRSLKSIDGGDQIGSGVKMSHVTPMFTQGTIARTENVTDLALDGAGFFTVETMNGRGYTRDGSFRVDREGSLTTSDGLKVLGFQADEKGGVTNKLGNISLGSTTVPAKATTEIKMMANLDSRDSATPFDPLKPHESSNFNTSIMVFDNVGTERMVQLFFNKGADNQWTYHAMVDGSEAANGVPGKLEEMGTGSLIFNEKGQLQEVKETKNSFNFNKGAKADQKITFNFGKSVSQGGNGSEGSTQYGSRSSVNRQISQDGTSAATLSSLSFNDSGILTASYDNGVTRDIAQIAVSKFDNNEGLYKMGKNLFKESKKSGQAAVGKPGLDGRGQILSKSLEQSNVDLADEFINLMNAQRNFQANTKTITTSDQMLQEVLNIRRS